MRKLPYFVSSRPALRTNFCGVDSRELDHNGEALTLTVSDNGRGMPAGVLDHFLRGETTGVGMAGMRERATALGGRLEFETLATGIAQS
jgi:signal transduction histidine kinase